MGQWGREAGDSDQRPARPWFAFVLRVLLTTGLMLVEIASKAFFLTGELIFMAEKVAKTESEWKQQLTPEQYHVTREAGTEPAFTGKYWKTKGCGDLSLRLLRTAVVRLLDKVRFRYGMAELLQNRRTRARWKSIKIKATEWSAPKLVAQAVARTLGMCLRMVLRRPGYAIA